MDDLIRRSDAIKSVLGITMLQGRVPMDTVIYQITSIPAVEPKHGEWVKVDHYWKGNEYTTIVECSVCKEQEEITSELYRYCPNCGAKMKGADDE